MLGTNVVSDLGLLQLSDHLPLQTTWGKQEFQSKLLDISTDASVLKRRQLPLMALRTHPSVCKSIQTDLGTIKNEIISADDILENKDERIQESVLQIFWKQSHMGAFLNQHTIAMNVLIFWRTILIPVFAVLAPFMAIVVPFFLLKFMHPGIQFTTDEYLSRVRQVFVQQMNIPSFLRSKHKDDIMGFIVESIFIALTGAMFISGIWSQITNALHTRTIWFDLETRGISIQKIYAVAKSSLAHLKTMNARAQKACSSLIQDGETATAACAGMEGLDGVATFGYVWNDSEPLHKIKTWIARLDCCATIASLESICFPKVLKQSSAELILKGVYHPSVAGCVSNNFQSSGHIILTGPNRGGKSTYCESVGLAIICAQTWGFAWADAMSWTPFRTILTALKSTGTIGEMSTFEAEIEFAKSVVAIDSVPAFVMMDEIFHSTNAADGFEASRVFMKQLYAKTGIVSMISTHYKNLAESFVKTATPICMEATEGIDTKLTYTYKVLPGVSDKSSVMEILAERGLLIRSAGA